jgi:hypothetical protein
MKKFLMLSAGLGAMTAAEQSKGRYMRAPDGHDDGGFAEFEKAGDVEVGSTKDAIETNLPTEEKPKRGGSGRPPREAKAAGKDKPAAAAAEKAKGAEKPDATAADADEDDDGENEDEDDDEDEDEKPVKPKLKASDRIRELNKRLRQEERLRLASDARLDTLEKSRLPGGAAGGNSAADAGKAPDPQDLAKYPLGHLDDRYIEDKLEWLATTKAADRADAVLQRQQENERNAQAEKARAELLDKVDDLSTRGAEISDDFQEAVVEAGMRGDWRLDQPTFEAAHEAENGAQILYDLSQDKKEAARVAGLSPYGQLKYVLDKDAEISGKGRARRIPGAGAPPATQTRGANSRTRISPSTENLDDFEKAWAADAKGK